MNAVRASYIDSLIGTPMTDLETVTRMHNAIHALDDIEQALTLFINSGTIEKVQTVKLEKAKNATRDKRPRTS